jgi:lipopolysaccharide export system protein LptA
VLRGERLEFDLVSGLAKLDGQVRGKTDGRVRGRFSIPDKDK